MAFPTLLLLLAGAHGAQDPATEPASRPESREDSAGARAALATELEQEGIRLDVPAGIVGVEAEVLVREELLEYLLVGPGGATHESLFVTEARPSVLNAALLLLGVEEGANARWIEPEEEPGPWEVLPPEGGGFFLYAAWREDGEVRLFRVEDLIANLATGRSMRRHRWVFLGSRFAQLPHAAEGAEPGEEDREEPREVFVADYEQNLINIAFFSLGNTLATCALPECNEQTIWIANPWLVPARGAPVLLVLARERLLRLPATWEEALVAIEDAPAGSESERAGG